MRLLVGGSADLLGELVDLRHYVRDLAQGGVEFLTQAETVVDDAGAPVHVLNRFARFLLNALDELGNFLGGLRRFFRQLADFVGDYSESQAMFTGSGRFDGCIQRQQVGLLRQVVNDLDDLADVIGPLPQHINDFARRTDGDVDLVQSVRGFLHGVDPAVHLFARAVGNVEQNFGSIGHALNRGHHLVDGSGSLAYARGLGLGVLHHVLHVDAHLVHGAGHFVDGRSGLQADFGRVVGGTGYLAGSAGHLGSGVAYVAHQVSQTFHHALKSVTQGVILGARFDLNRKVATGNGLGDRCHLFQVSHHAVEGATQFTNLVFSLDIDFVIQIARRADLLGDLDEVAQRFGDGLGGTEGNDGAKNQRRERAQKRDSDGPVACGVVTLAALFKHALAFRVRQIKIFGRTLHPGARVFLQVEDLQFSYGGVPLIDFFPLLHQWFGEVPGPILFRLLHFGEGGSLLLGCG